MLVLQPIMSGTSTFLTNYPLLNSLLLNEVNAGSFVRKLINEIDNVHGQNRLFWPNLQQVKPLRKQLSLTVSYNLFVYWCNCGYTYSFKWIFLLKEKIILFFIKVIIHFKFDNIILLTDFWKKINESSESYTYPNFLRQPVSISSIGVIEVGQYYNYLLKRNVIKSTKN